MKFFNIHNDIFQDATDQKIIQMRLDAYYSGLSRELASQPERVHSVPQRQKEFQSIVDSVVSFAKDLWLFELACGIGFWTEKLQKTARFVFATDICEIALQIARERVVSERVNFTKMDSLNIHMPNRLISGVFGGFWLSHVCRESLSDFFSQLDLQLNTGTQVLFLENEYPDRGRRPFPSIDSKGNTFELRHHMDGSRHFVLKNYFSDEELMVALSHRASKVQIKRLIYYWTLTYEIG